MLKTIIVDDELIIRQGIKQLIPWEELGYSIEDEASDGESALTKLKSAYFHVMITDISMPNMNGLELIKEIRTFNSELKIIVLSGYNEFEYVKEAMKYQVDNYLLKPISEQELIETLRNVKHVIKTKIEHQYLGSEHSHVLINHLMNRMIQHKISTIEFRNRANFLQIEIPSAPYRMAVIELESLAAKYEEELDSLEYVILYACLNVVKEIFRNDGLASVVFEDNQHRIVCLFEDGTTTVTPEQRMEDILQAIRIYVKTTVTIALSDPVYALSGLHQAYSEANKLIEYTFFLGYNLVVTSNSIPISSHVSINEEEWLSSYERSIRSCSLENTKQIITELFTRKLQEAVPTRAYIEYLSMKFIFNSVEVLKEFNGNLSFLYDGQTSLYQRLTALNSIDAIADHLILISSEVITNIQRLQQSRPSKIIEAICSYIDEHYAEDIKLKDIGEIYYMNSSYLGKLFRKDKGESFNDYLNKVRLTQAKHLLKSTNQRIYQIAELVGYKDYNYFCKIFKQQFGVLPSNIK